MLVHHKKPFMLGLFMAVTFLGVLVSMFLPILNGKNILDAADDLFNSVSKQSSYYIPELQEKAGKYLQAGPVEAKITLPDADEVAHATAVLKADGAEVSASGNVLKVKGNLGKILQGTLTDSDAMFKNNDEAIAKTYGISAKQAVYARYLALKGIQKDLKAKKQFEPAKDIEHVLMKGVEVAYNFNGILPKPVSANIGILVASLIFYLVYTMWWGYAIMWLCDGIGLQMKAGGKREH